jgi:hypothetical protein
MNIWTPIQTLRNDKGQSAERQNILQCTSTGKFTSHATDTIGTSKGSFRGMLCRRQRHLYVCYSTTDCGGPMCGGRCECSSKLSVCWRSVPRHWRCMQRGRAFVVECVKSVLCYSSGQTSPKLILKQAIHAVTTALWNLMFYEAEIKRHNYYNTIDCIEGKPFWDAGQTPLN